MAIDLNRKLIASGRAAERYACNLLWLAAFRWDMFNRLRRE